MSSQIDFLHITKTVFISRQVAVPNIYANFAPKQQIKGDMKVFNTTGKCIPSMHYMVDISRQVEDAAKLVRRGNYFCINRGRQYGKTTTLALLKKKLEAEGYAVFSLSFEGLSESAFKSEETLLYMSLCLMQSIVEWENVQNLSPESAALLTEYTKSDKEEISSLEYSKLVAKLCKSSKVVVLIDEVDAAGNHIEFIKFLGILREMYLSRDERPTFQSVILAGVYDIKNLKLKLRPEEQHQYNSPWNIAMPFDSDMSLPADGIVGMLAEYKTDHQLDLDEHFIGQMIFDYTSGYPFLASRLCQIIDDKELGWDKEGVLKAVNALLKEHNTLFDDMEKKVSQFPSLAETLKSIIFGGKRVSFNYYDRDINIAVMFNFVKEKEGAAVIFCRIFETWLYNLFISNAKQTPIYQQGEYDKPRFVHDGYLDMRLLLERFCVHFNEIYRPGHDDEFVENNGRQIFLTYLRPVINGVGNYYCEAQTRDLTRTDVIIDYLGQQYVVELKIWRGDAYNERGEQQLSEYLDYYHLQTGYMLSFCFNKNKQPGVHEVIVGGKKLIEVVV